MLIAKKNGDGLYSYLQPQAMNDLYLRDRVHPKEIEREANRLAFNFAASFKTTIEVIERVAKAWGDKDRLELLYKSESLLFDLEFAYRFWVRLRNYIVHSRTIYSGLVCNGTKTQLTVDCEKNSSWRGWNKQLKLEIEKIGCETDYSDTIVSAENTLMVLAYSYIELFHEEYDLCKLTTERFKQKYQVKGELYFSSCRNLDSGYFHIALQVPCWEFENIESIKRFVQKNGLDRFVLPTVMHR